MYVDYIRIHAAEERERCAFELNAVERARGWSAEAGDRPSGRPP